jgi:hypothetical protein
MTGGGGDPSVYAVAERRGGAARQLDKVCQDAKEEHLVMESGSGARRPRLPP